MAEYKAYKDADIGKVGSIPAHWEITRIGNLFEEVSDRYETGTAAELPLLSVSEYYGIAKRSDKIADDSILIRAESLDGYKICCPGDIVSNIMLTWKGALGSSPYTGIVSPAYCVYRSKSVINSRYFHYLFRTKAYTDVFRVNSTGLIDSRLRLYTPKFFALYALVPPKPEQDLIVEYLDKTTQHIDAIIAEVKASIEEYKAWKASIIYETVTKGLDPNEEMKDSGIDYIGEIPSTWVTKRLRNIGTTQNGISKSAEFFGQGYPFVSYGDVYKNFSLPEIPSGLVLSTDDERSHYSVEEGDIFFTRTSETIDEIGFSCVCEKTIPDATFAGFLIRVRPYTDDLLTGFSKYYFRSVHHRAFFVKEMNLVTRASLSQGLLKSMPVLIPPKDEQKRIAEYLDEKCSAVDALIQEKQGLITDLEAYKKSLIFEVVTGKRKV